jgi:hypothetical protein
MTFAHGLDLGTHSARTSPGRSRTALNRAAGKRGP